MGAPREAMALAYASGGYSLSAIGRHFGVHYSTVSRTAKPRPQRPRRDPNVVMQDLTPL